MSNVLQHVKRVFPQYEVKIQPSKLYPFANIISVFVEKGEKYNPDGFPNPKWWWYKRGILVEKDETKINQVALEEDLATIKKEIETMGE